MKDNPIVCVTTADGLELYGMLLSASKKNAIILNIHGTADNFYDNMFVWKIAEAVRSLGISMLSVNNRGSYNLEFYDYGPDARRNSGACVEIFEKCVEDIDAWIRYALSLGYKKIILEGHSLGTEKVVYYMSHGTYAKKVSAVILLGFSDSFGHHMEFLKKANVDFMREAKALITKKKKNQFLTRRWMVHAGIMPQSAESYVNFFSKNSELSKAFPLRKGKDLELYQKINVPILGVIGDEEEYCIVPIKKAISVLREENKCAEVHQLKHCDHSFSGKEKELADVVKKFLRENLK